MCIQYTKINLTFVLASYIKRKELSFLFEVHNNPTVVIISGHNLDRSLATK